MLSWGSPFPIAVGEGLSWDSLFPIAVGEGLSWDSLFPIAVGEGFFEATLPPQGVGEGLSWGCPCGGPKKLALPQISCLTGKTMVFTRKSIRWENGMDRFFNLLNRIGNNRNPQAR
jgi:hypothetical protein